jgi:PERQ amino acid-rich with GYF domain-containing protein
MMSRKSSVSVESEMEVPIVTADEIPEEPEVAHDVAPTPEFEDIVDSTVIPPVAATPSPARVAPWATKPDDPKKSLSLKQIQDLEAKRAAEQTRRITAERQLLAQQAAVAAAAQQTPVQQGLPQGSTWGSVAAKGWTAKPAPVTPSPGKKTMSQIQKEEEEERARLARGKDISAPTAVMRGYAGAAAAVKVCPWGEC